MGTPAATKPRIWIDISHTCDSGLNTGIQRVVRNLAQHLPEVARTEGIECQTVVVRNGVFHRWDAYQVRWGAQTYRQWKQRSRYSRLLQLPAKVYFGARACLQRLDAARTEAIMRPGDWLLLPDGYWAMHQFWKSVTSAKAKGIRCCSVVYDLIPLLRPEFFPHKDHSRFEVYLRRIVADADLVLCISHAVAGDFRRFAANCGLSPSTLDERVSVFPLGADLPAPVQDRPSTERVRELVSQNVPYGLVVGTLEPRKNHIASLRAMELLWARGCQAHLVWVGRVGWMSSDVQKELVEHPESGRRLHHLCGLNDGDLACLYRHSSVVICPSFIEGFGLPIVEGLHFNRPVLASNIPIYREVGRDRCQYFEPDSPDRLSELLEPLLQRQFIGASDADQVNAYVESPGLKTWQQSAESVFRRMMSR